MLGTGSRCFVLALPVVCSLKRRECQSQQYGLFLCMKKSPQKTSDNVYKNMKGCQDVLSSENLKGKKLQKSISHMNWFVKSVRVCEYKYLPSVSSPECPYLDTDSWTSVGDRVTLGMGLWGRHRFLKL